MKQVYLSYYATPVLVGALCNIMPSSVPTALLHDLSRMLFSKLILKAGRIMRKRLSLSSLLCRGQEKMTIHSDWMNLLFTSQPVIRGCADKEEEPPSSPGHRLPIGDKKSSQGIGPNAAVPPLLHQLQHVLKGSM
ncbi:hypothetical protein V5799_028095 [Amblyomma americanum]|uniref:Uncharacterized protein n=1 Tax=Amblyomma americanum TaxID=6943 RepID=A0AAQ4DDV0_AMBAM